MNEDNPFGNQSREDIMRKLLNQGLVKRITIIEGNYPTNKEQRAFVQRITDWLHRKPE